MGLRVNTNIASLKARRDLGVVSHRLYGDFRRLASGPRITAAADAAVSVLAQAGVQPQIALSLSQG